MPIPNGRNPRGGRRPASRLRVEALEAIQLMAAGPLSGFLTGPAVGQPLDIALAYVSAHGADYGLTGDDPARAFLTDQYVDKGTGATHIYLRQGLDGLKVLNQDLSITVTKDGAIVAVNGGFNPHLGTLAPRPTPPAPAVGPVDAVRAAALGLKVLDGGTVTMTTGPAGVEQSSILAAPGISLNPVPVHLQYVAAADGAPVLAWDVVIKTLHDENWYDAAVDAQTGALLHVDNWVDHFAASYNVYSLPNATRSPDDGPRVAIQDPADPVASPYGWQTTKATVGAEFTDTRGNNVRAQEDHAADNSGNGFRPNAGPTLNFDFPIDFTLDPTKYEAASITNTFYWTNVYHDILYQYGFDEAAGNFQTNNYGHGGLGTDQVEADAQDGSGVNNANFGTPPDGTSGRMQMYIFNITNPNRDGDLDPEVIVHELGHGLSNRLTGGPANAGGLQTLQSRGMGEGWSDYWSLALLQKPGDTATTARPVGNYVLGLPASGGGVRRYPYDVDMQVNPQTIGDYNTDTSGGGSPEVHNTGELWVDALWDMHWNLINKYGFSPDLYYGNGGNNLAIRLVVDAMKIQPANPTFAEARDAILKADMLLNGGIDLPQIWNAFARRGMGLSFNSGVNSSATVVKPATDVPNFLAVTAVAPAGLTEGTTYTDITVATISDPNGGGQPTSAYTARVDFGDGTAPVIGKIVPAGNNTFSVLATHSFAQGGKFRETVTVARTDGSGTASGTVIIPVADLPLTAQPIAAGLTVDEGAPTDVQFGTFTSTSPVAKTSGGFVATVDYGDGVAVPATITATSTQNVFSVHTTHVFQGGVTAAVATVTAPGGTIVTLTRPVQVNDGVLVLAAAADPVTTFEDVTLTTPLATFTDGDLQIHPASYYAATVDWGDGTTGPATIAANTLGNPGFSVLGTHRYKLTSAPLVARVTINDADISTSTGTVNVLVAATPILAETPSLSAVEGAPFTGVVAAFDTPQDKLLRGDDFTAMVNYNDGQDPTPGRVSYEGNGRFTVIATHAFAFGDTAIATTLKRVQAPDLVLPLLTATVTVAPATVLASPTPTLAASEGVEVTALVANFASANPNALPADFTAKVNWGDGTTSDPSAVTIRVIPGGGGFQAVATHTYVQQGVYVVSTEVDGKNGSTAFGFVNAVVADAPLTVSVTPPAANQKVAFTAPVATFVSQNAQANIAKFAAAINWGDGTTTAGTVGPGADPGTFTVVGGHTYAEGGPYTLTVTVVSTGGSTAVGASTIRVGDILLPIAGAMSPASDSGRSNSDGITNVTTPTFIGRGVPNSTVHLFVQRADGNGPVPAGGGLADASGSWSVATTPLPDGTYAVFASATDSVGRPTSPLTQLLPTTGRGPLVVDTAGPRVSGLKLDPRRGQLVVNFADGGGGLDAAALSAATDYAIRSLAGRGASLAVTGISLSPAGVGGTETVTLTLNGGRRLRAGAYSASISAAGLVDLAGNKLDERYFVAFPSLYSTPGADYVAQLNTNGVALAQPVQLIPPSEIKAAAKHASFIRGKTRFRFAR